MAPMPSPSHVENEDKSYLPSITFRFDNLFTDDGALSVVLICVFAILLLMLFLIVFILTRLCKCCQAYPNTKRTDTKGRNFKNGSQEKKSRRSVSSPHVKAFLTSGSTRPHQINPDIPITVNNSKPPTFIFGWFGTKPSNQM